MPKLRLNFRLSTLMLLVLFMAIGMWVFTIYGVRTGVVIIEEYRITPRFHPESAEMKIVFRFLQPTAESCDAIHGDQYNYVLKIPSDFVPVKSQNPGDQIVFHYREKPLWLGFGQRTFWKKDVEHPLNRFWNELFRTSDHLPLSDAQSKVMDSVLEK